jgi:hypothetical protein
MRVQLPRSARLALAAALSSTLLAPPALADKGGRGEGREEFRGIVTEVPEGRVGAWVIGGRTVTSDRGTELDEAEGPLAVGACAKVELRGGRVHEIDSEPASDCR